MKKKILILATISLFLFATGFWDIALAKGGGKTGVTSVKVTPVTTKVKTGKTKIFKVHFKGKWKFDKSIDWYVNDVLGGNETVGTLNQTSPTSATYTPPATPPNPDSVTIKVVSVADPTKSDTSKVKIELSSKKKYKLKGVAAKGAPIVNAEVEVKDATGKLVGKGMTDTDGSYAISYSGEFKLPFIIKVNDLAGVLYSITNNPSKPANVTPLTNKAVETFVVQNGGDLSDGEVMDDVKEISGKVADINSAIAKALETIKNALGLITTQINFISSELKAGDPEDFYDDLLDVIEESIKDAGYEDMDDLIKVDDNFIDVNNSIVLAYGDKGLKPDEGEDLENVSAEDPDEDEQPEIKGLISTQDSGNMTVEVNGLSIFVNELTEIEMKDANGNDVAGSFADLTVGKFVEVKAKLDGSSLVAVKIEIKNESQKEDEDEFEGTIDQKNDATSTIVVENSLIYVTDETEIEVNDVKGFFTDLAVGQTVEVKTTLSDSKLTAKKIEVKGSDKEENDKD